MALTTVDLDDGMEKDEAVSSRFGDRDDTTITKPEPAHQDIVTVPRSNAVVRGGVDRQPVRLLPGTLDIVLVSERDPFWDRPGEDRKAT